MHAELCCQWPERLIQPFQGELGSAIGVLKRLAEQAAQAADGNQPPGTGFAHARQHGLGGANDAEKIYRHGVLELCQRALFQCTDAAGAGAVDEHVHATEFVEYLCKGVVNGGVVGDVKGNDAQVSRCGLRGFAQRRSVGVEGARCNQVSTLCELFAGTQPDSGVGAGDDDSLSRWHRRGGVSHKCRSIRPPGGQSGRSGQGLAGRAGRWTRPPGRAAAPRHGRKTSFPRHGWLPSGLCAPSCARR